MGRPYVTMPFLMPIISQTLRIDATPRRIFRCLVSDPPRLMSWWDALTQHELTHAAPRFIGTLLRYAYLLHGLRLKGEYEIVDFVPSRYLFARTLSGISAVVEVVIDDDGAATTLDFALNYALPGALLGSSTHAPALEAQLEQDISTMLHHLKAEAEQHTHPAQKNSQQT